MERILNVSMTALIPKYWVYILGLYIGIMEKEMETTIVDYRRVLSSFQDCKLRPPAL